MSKLVIIETLNDSGDGVTINTHRQWNRTRVRNVCINNQFYTCGDNNDYEHMLNMVDQMAPNTANMYLVAKDICKHSEDQTVTNIMFILESEAVITTYKIDDSDEY